MKKNRLTFLILAFAMIMSIFSLAGCSSNNDTTKENNTQTEENADMEGKTDDLTGEDNEESDNNKENEVTLTIDTPAEGETISQTVTVIGKAEGNVKSVKCVITSNGTHIGEGTSLVADVSHEYSAKVNCTLPDDIERGENGTIHAEIKVTALDEADQELKSETRTVALQ